MSKRVGATIARFTGGRFSGILAGLGRDSVRRVAVRIG